MEEKDLHLDVYLDHSVFYYNGETTVFQEGKQTEAAQKRYAKVTNTLEQGYLESIYNNCTYTNFDCLDIPFRKLLEELVNGITSEVGRALVGLTFIQITIKSIVPEQSIRLHKGSSRSGSFSWKEGISMRTLDSTYSTPFLKAKGLLNVNKYGIMMTRSLAENYPYSKLYKAEMRGAFDVWIQIVDAIESGMVNCEVALAFLMALLINNSIRFEAIAHSALQKLPQIQNCKLNEIEDLFVFFYTNTRYSARAFEVVIHGFMQAYKENGFTDLELVEMSQMRSANKKHGNVGDIELKEGKQIVEAWDAKYGKSYLYDELGELLDKLEANPGVSVAGFIVNDMLDLKYEVIERVEEIEAISGTSIKLFTFRDWVEYKLENVPDSNRNAFAKDWLTAVVESFARKRLDIAPIDEPCEGWLIDLNELLS